MKKNHYAKMKRSIMGSMILVPLLTLVLILGIGYYHFASSLETNTISSIRRIVEDHGQMIDSFLEERKADLAFISRSYPYGELSHSQKLGAVFARLQKQSSTFVDLGVFDHSGVHVAYEGPFRLEGKVYQNASWFKEVMRKGYYISDVFLGYRRIPHFVIALAKEEMGKRWILRATIDTHLFNALVKKVRIGKTGEAYLLNAEGMFQTERRSGGSLMSKDPDIIPYPSSQKGIHTFFHRDGRGENYVYATTWLRNKKWLLVVRQEKADAFQSLRTATYLIILASIVGVMAIVLLAAYLTGRIVRRMEEMDSEKVRLSDQLVRASRLAELGEMAAGFAHEINNPLQIIKNEQALMAVLLSELKEAGELRPSESLKEIEDSMDQIDYQITRCAEITQAILKFGRQSEPHVKELDLRDFLPQVTGMVEKKASVHGIALTQRISEDVPPIHGDPGQLQQVLLNLYNNAIDAIVTRHGSAGGELGLDAARGTDGKVEIIFHDNGCGISLENQKRIFTPFFTTKPMGKGTGLGLSVCYGIINHMGGVMEVSSEEGVGTSVAIRLPAAKR